MNNPTTDDRLNQAKLRLRGRIGLEQRQATAKRERDRIRRERSAEVRVTSQMDVAPGAIAKGFRGVDGGLDTPAFQQARPYAIGRNPCQCPPPPIRQQSPGKPKVKGEVVFIYIATEPDP